MASKVSFTIRRPTPVSRAESSGPDSDSGSTFKVPQLPSHLVNGDTPALGSPLAKNETSSPYPQHESAHGQDPSDEDSVNEDELVTGFDRFGVQRLNGERKVEKPLVIPALKNKDWREVARKRRNAQYVPPSAAAQTGADGSVGGLGTKDTINSGPVLSGLQLKKKTMTTVAIDDQIVQEIEDVKMEVIEDETEDQKALRAILAEASGEAHFDGPMIDIIPTNAEENAFKQDVAELPDAATLEDYDRVPVSQFGAAMLRGMGWKEGTAATRKPGKGMVEPYIPAARPALLGIGAKEQEVYDDGSKKKGFKQRSDRKYVPVLKQERSGSGTASPAPSSRDRRERSRSPRRSAPTSRLNSPDRYGGRKDESRRRNDYDGRRRDTDRKSDDKSQRDDYRNRDRDRSDRKESDRDRERRYDRDEGRDRRDERDGRDDRDRRDDRYDSSSRRRKDY